MRALRRTFHGERDILDASVSGEVRHQLMKRAVLNGLKQAIAPVAQEAAHNARAVVVIDHQRYELAATDECVRSFAQRTDPALLSEHGIVIGERQVVPPKQIFFSPVAGARSGGRIHDVGGVFATKTVLAPVAFGSGHVASYHFARWVAQTSATSATPQRNCCACRVEAGPPEGQPARSQGLSLMRNVARSEMLRSVAPRKERKVEPKKETPLPGDTTYPLSPPRRVSRREFARRLRKAQTPAERVLWEQLRRNQLGVKFHRQTPLLRFTVDFWCPSKSLAIEVDGSSHYGRRGYDARRDVELAEFNVTTLRFTNREVFTDLAGVVASIQAEVDRLPTMISEFQYAHWRRAAGGGARE